MGITAELALASAFEVEVADLYVETAPKQSEASAPKDFQVLKRLVSGASFLSVIESWSVKHNVMDKLEGEQRQAVEDFFQHMHVWAAVGREVEPNHREKACEVFQTKLDELDARGIYVFGGSSRVSALDGTVQESGRLVFKRADDPEIIQPKLLRQFGKTMCLVTVPVERPS